ncbi:MAG: hypothetical protein H0V02_02325 [Nocardioidaceae bacterium]|nr:hypothetical protein [Nocardioidaceae bacterium]
MNHTFEKDALIRELQDRSRDIGGHPIALENVKQSARRIRLRRRIGSGVAAAAVLSVAVPTAVALTDGANSTPVPAAPVPSPTVTDTADPLPDGPVVLTTDGLPRGEDPQVPYILNQERRLVTPDRTVQLPNGYAMITPYDGGWLAVGTGRSGYQTVRLDEDMDVLSTVPGGPALVTRADGSRVAYVAVNRVGETVLVNASADGSDVASAVMPEDREITAVGFLDSDTVLYQTNDAQPIVALDHPGGPTSLEGFLNVRAVSEANGLVAGLVSFSNDEVCSGVMDPAASTSKLVWKTCDYALETFSADGQFIVAGTAQADGMGSPTLAILNAQTGEPVIEFMSARGQEVAVNQSAWEDSDSVIAMVYDDGEWTMLRATTSGELEEVTDPRPALGDSLPYWFAETPHN